MAQKFDISEYEYHEFGGRSRDKGAENYVFQDFQKLSKEISSVNNKVIRLESNKSTKPNFQLSPIVKKYRGLLEEEEKEKERRISDSVEMKVSEIYEKAFDAGREEGLNLGKQEAFDHMRDEVDRKISLLNEFIEEVLAFKEKIITQQKDQIIYLLKNISKWIILRELEEDGQYIYRLLEKLILEIQTRENLLIRVGDKYYTQISDVLEQVEKNLGKLTNIRIEPDYNIEDIGVILESENGIIDSRMTEQLNILSEIFDSSFSHT